MNRRDFIQTTTLAAFSTSPLMTSKLLYNQKFDFDISLAEFSFASELYGGKMKNMDFPTRAVKEFDIHILEYVSGFFFGKHTDQNYLKELKTLTDDLGVKNHLIMVDGENLASLKDDVRKKAVESHLPWLDAAKYLGCDKIRVNLGDATAMMTGKPEEGNKEDTAKAAADGYQSLLEHAEKMDMYVIVENHFRYSSDPDWLLSVFKQVPSTKKGFLPDFGNFCMERSKPEGSDIASIMKTKCLKEYDKYDGVKKLMPFAKGISAKTHRFNDQGDDIDTDFIKMFKIIKDSGWNNGIVGIEYEGGIMHEWGKDESYLTNVDGIKKTKALLEKVLRELNN